MDLGARATSVKFLIGDRAGQFAGSFDGAFTAGDVRILISPPQALRANAICERFPVRKMWICKPVGGRRGAEWQVS